MSYSKTISDAVVTAIAGMASPPAVVVLRKQDSLLKSDVDGDFPMCVVSMAEDGVSLGQSFGGTILKAYTIGVTVWRKHDALIQTNVDTVPALTLSIQQTINTGTLTGAPTVCDSDIVGFTPFEKDSFKEGYEVSRARLVYTSAELRNG